MKTRKESCILPNGFHNLLDSVDIVCSTLADGLNQLTETRKSLMAYDGKRGMDHYAVDLREYILCFVQKMDALIELLKNSRDIVANDLTNVDNMRDEKNDRENMLRNTSELDIVSNQKNLEPTDAELISVNFDQEISNDSSQSDEKNEQEVKILNGDVSSTDTSENIEAVIEDLDILEENDDCTLSVSTLLSNNIANETDSSKIRKEDLVMKVVRNAKNSYQKFLMSE